MAKKYNTEFKLKLIRLCESEQQTVHVVARQYAVPPTSLRHWLACYREHGIAGIVPKTSCYSGEFKLSVLQWMWDRAVSYQRAAAHFNIRSPSWIGVWARQYQSAGPEALGRQSRGGSTPMPVHRFTPDEPPYPVTPTQPRTLAQLEKENEYLRAEVAYLKKLDALIREKQAAAHKKRGSSKD